MPAGERARKRRAAQAAFSVARPARRLCAGKRQCVCRRSALLLFAVSFFVIAGLDPAIHAEGKLDRICR
jgi:hypothetical protein